MDWKYRTPWVSRYIPVPRGTAGGGELGTLRTAGPLCGGPEARCTQSAEEARCTQSAGGPSGPRAPYPR